MLILYIWLGHLSVVEQKCFNASGWNKSLRGGQNHGELQGRAAVQKNTRRSRVSPTRISTASKNRQMSLGQLCDWRPSVVNDSKMDADGDGCTRCRSLMQQGHSITKGNRARLDRIPRQVSLFAETGRDDGGGLERNMEQEGGGKRWRLAGGRRCKDTPFHCLVCRPYGISASVSLTRLELFLRHTEQQKLGQREPPARTTLRWSFFTATCKMKVLSPRVEWISGHEARTRTQKRPRNTVSLQIFCCQSEDKLRQMKVTSARQEWRRHEKWTYRQTQFLSLLFHWGCGQICPTESDSDSPPSNHKHHKNNVRKEKFT